MEQNQTLLLEYKPGHKKNPFFSESVDAKFQNQWLLEEDCGKEIQNNYGFEELEREESPQGWNTHKDSSFTKEFGSDINFQRERYNESLIKSSQKSFLKHDFKEEICFMEPQELLDSSDGEKKLHMGSEDLFLDGKELSNVHKLSQQFLKNDNEIFQWKNIELEKEEESSISW